MAKKDFSINHSLPYSWLVHNRPWSLVGPGQLCVPATNDGRGDCSEPAVDVVPAAHNKMEQFHKGVAAAAGEVRVKV